MIQPDILLITTLQNDTARCVVDHNIPNDTARYDVDYNIPK
jgi:hypothetical protein